MCARTAGWSPAASSHQLEEADLEGDLGLLGVQTSVLHKCYLPLRKQVTVVTTLCGGLNENAPPP